ncbi:NAD-dependent epimerase/dehydratase family protein [Streptomyces sp. 3MP-14]|uniref:NAD-dependent epimerase/dehydratase family protein n=1 Tax=Streptomyces mimosae TaxID=2586635 RepID=A0A5N6AMJ3_9ACTN|nr:MULTISPECIES: NAD(P)-dependent oxidoreductase [Streptomyces]KAB8168838.1 NAD-dependent epimerase/dehydratase family protein [Streptomyces mimosae]KAB8177882.1 NAD-dependent epimerase/dehydratase family protein [Streptomyces sp. 3MP-14]
MPADQPAERDTATPLVLLTGAAGGVGTLMRELLPAHGYRLRSLDMVPIADEPDAVVADLADHEALRAAVRGTDAILHLAGISLESTFEKILRANIEGTYRLYEAAREEGVRRIVFASSNHAVGATPWPGPGDPPIPVDTPHRPDTFYGLSKCFGEDLAQYYWDKHGIETVSIRIGSCFPKATSVRMLSVWLSPADGARLFHSALSARDVGHTVVYGSSANTRTVWDLEPARALGYAPQDDSEIFAAELIAKEGELDPTRPEQAQLGGHFLTDPPIWPH